MNSNRTLESELTKLKELEAKATPGPWVYDSYSKIIGWDDDIAKVPVEGGDTATKQGAHDAWLIQAMRNVLPKLIKTIEIQQEVIRKVKSNRDGKEQIEALWTE